MKFDERNLRWVILALCAVAALRVFVFAAAFPFFNNVDEQAHVDLVIKYLHAKPPHGIEPFSSEAARYFTLYSSPEYFLTSEQLAAEDLAPAWTLTGDVREKIVSAAIPVWESRPNHESGEPPLYYAIAGAWMNLGRALGLDGLTLLYWVRFLNVVFAALLVWIGFVVARSTFPESRFVQLGIAALLALWPQSAFYSTQADALSPICFGVAFLGLTKILLNARAGILVAIWTGLAMAATCLTKTSNLSLPIAAVIVLAAKIIAVERKQSLRQALLTFAVFLISFAIPTSFWFVSNYQRFGDLTATKSKIELLGWTIKPITAWLPHPLLSLHGLREFWPELSASFWRGEFVWHLQRLASPFADNFYAIVTALVIFIAVVLLLRRQARGEDPQFVLWLALLSFLSIVALLVILSLRFDFGQCPYPSREHPYFTSGRLLNAAAIPFFLLFVYVIDRIADWLKRDWLRWVLLGATIVIVLVSQLQTNAPAFASRYNFFHRKAL
ncbi:MAG TPA: DUF2142 domain-containing protein [Chthoniobacterales bacterium]|nr:DUF2142 domain-containing protein [Chthoniobacterales bacterium]